MFSARTSWSRTPNPLHDAVERRKRSGAPILDLTVSNPTAAGLPWPDADGLLAALASAQTLNYVPEPFGSPAARTALADWFGSHGLTIDPARLCLTASTSESYGFLFKLLCDPGDAVLVPSPSYPLFEYLAGLDGVALRRYELRYDGEWHIDSASLDEALAESPRPRAIIAIHPNNPTGHYLKTDELELLVERSARHGLALISDEVFFEHWVEGVPAGTPAPPGLLPAAVRAASQNRCLTFSLGGLSKLAGLPQIKLGWIAASGPEKTLEEALARLEIVADSALSVSASAQLALPYVLGADRFVDRVRARLQRNLAVLDAALERVPEVTRLRCEGGWTAMLRLPAVRSSEAWAIELLERQGVLVQPGHFYDLSGALRPDAYVVLSLLCAESPFSAGASGLGVAVKG